MENHRTLQSDGIDACSSSPKEAHHFFDQALSALKQNDLQQASEWMYRTLALCPGEGHYWRALGEVLSKMELYIVALSAFEHALTLQGASAEIHFSIATALTGLDRKTEASDHFSHSTQLSPEWPEAWFNHGVLLLQLSRPEAALVALQKAVDLRPDWSAAWFNLGCVADQLGLYDQAHLCWQHVLSIEPENIHALINMGIALLHKEKMDKAKQILRTALSIEPELAKAHMHLGLCHQRSGCIEDALLSYRQALSLEPNYAEAWFNLADGLRTLERWDEVIDCYAKVLATNPENAAAHFNLAVALRRKERISEALEHCSQARSLDPDFSEATAYLLQLAQHACDWNLVEQLSPIVNQLSARQILEGRKPAESPMLSLRRHADPEKNLAIAKAWSRSIEQNVRVQPQCLGFNHRPRAERPMIRVGYISNDFKDHAVAHHLLGLLRNHHRERFRIYLYACNSEDGSDYRPKMVHACDHFIEIDQMSDAAAAQRVYDDGIDILVDLMGHTRGARLEILSMRPAPVQVSYLGFLGTSGASFIDYFISDEVVTPPELSQYFTEKLVYLPGCYQVNDDRMPIAEPVERSKFGLKEDQLVLCCFNQSYKIDRRCFHAWLTILNKVPKAVLWLLRPNTRACENLCRATVQAGISADRLIFAKPLRIDYHLARLRLADLALDTLTYNGGATTANALWAGVPVLTMAGHHLLSRMSASALKALGLPEMITYSIEDYTNCAISLLRDGSKLAYTRARLERLKLGSPLFDPRKFSIHLESAFEQMVARFDAGKPSVSFSIQPSVDPATRSM